MKASNIYQTLKTKGHATDGTKPMLPGVGSPLKKSPYKFNAGLKKAAADGSLDSNPKFKEAVKAAPTKLKNDPVKKPTVKETKYSKYGYKKEVVKPISTSYNSKTGELTRVFSDKDVKDKGIKKVQVTKASEKSPASTKSPAKKTIDPPKRKKTTTVENFNYGDQFSSTVKTKQKNKKNGEVKVKQKSTSKNYNPATGKRTSKSVSKAKAKLETYDENVSSDPSEGTVKKSNIVSLKKSYKTKGSPKVKGKVTGSGSKSGAQSVTGKGLDKSLDNVNTLDVRRNLKSPAKKKSCGGRGNKI